MKDISCIQCGQSVGRQPEATTLTGLCRSCRSAQDLGAQRLFRHAQCELGLDVRPVGKPDYVNEWRRQSASPPK